MERSSLFCRLGCPCFKGSICWEFVFGNVIDLGVREGKALVGYAGCKTDGVLSISQIERLGVVLRHMAQNLQYTNESPFFAFCSLVRCDCDAYRLLDSNRWRKLIGGGPELQTPSEVRGRA